MPDIKILPEARDKQAAYHRTAIAALAQIARTYPQPRTYSARRLAQATLDALETHGDSMVAAVRVEREDS